MQRNEQHNPVGPIELGTVSGDTKGDAAPHWEAVGLRSNPGICDD
ncbi:MAG: hypothetical protein ACT4N8_03785 [Sphingosinicella sp.]